jgi:agmatinase
MRVYFVVNVCMQTLNPGFLGLEEDEAVSLSDAKAVVIPFGLEASVSYGGGTKKGPRAMMEASHEVELFDEQFWCEPYKHIGIATLKEPIITDNVSEALMQLEYVVEQVLDKEQFPIVFGGEHSITAGAIRPFVKRHDEVVLLHFDAHADLRDGYMGEHFSHASAIRRCLDHDNVSVVSLGIRNISQSEIAFYEENKSRIHIFWAKDKKHFDIDKVISLLKGKTVYVTFDVDGLDASLMPATGTPEPGGLFWDEVIEVLDKASQVCHIVGADVNELAPIEGFHGPDFIAAKLAYKILTYAFRDKLPLKGK